MNLGTEPYKLYGVTRDGNGNKIEIFVSAFATEQEALNYPINSQEYEERNVVIEEDESA